MSRQRTPGEGGPERDLESGPERPLQEPTADERVARERPPEERHDPERPDPGPLAEAPPLELRVSQAHRLIKVWQAPKGWRYWSAVNNTEVGLWYTCAAFVFFLFGGVLALLMRIPGGRHLRMPTISSTAAAMAATSMNDRPSSQMSAPMPGW